MAGKDKALAGITLTAYHVTTDRNDAGSLGIITAWGPVIACAEYGSETCTQFGVKTDA